MKRAAKDIDVRLLACVLRDEFCVTLTPRLAQLVVCLVQGLSHDDTASAMGWTTRTLYTRIVALLKRFRHDDDEYRTRDDLVRALLVRYWYAQGLEDGATK